MQIGEGRQFIPILPTPYTLTYQNKHSYPKILGLHEEKEVQFNECSRQKPTQWYHLPISYKIHLHPQILQGIQGNQSTISPQDGKRYSVSNSSWIPATTPKVAFWETLKGLILIPTGYQQTKCLPLQPEPVSWAQSSSQLHQKAVHLPQGGHIRSGSLLLTDLIILKTPLFGSGDLITLGSTFLSYLGTKLLVTLKHKTFPLTNICYLAF